jgi:hypothetical protein
LGCVCDRGTCGAPVGCDGARCESSANCSATCYCNAAHAARPTRTPRRRQETAADRAPRTTAPAIIRASAGRTAGAATARISAADRASRTATSSTPPPRRPRDIMRPLVVHAAAQRPPHPVQGSIPARRRLNNRWCTGHGRPGVTPGWLTKWISTATLSYGGRNDGGAALL